MHEYVCCTGSTLRISSTVPVSTTFASSSRLSSARSGHVPSAPGRARAATTRSSSSGCRGARPDGRRLAMARAEDGGRRPEQAHGPGRARDWTGQDGTQLLGGGGSAGGAGADRGRTGGGTRGSTTPFPPPPAPARPAPCDPRRPRTKRRDGGAGRRPGWGRERASLGRAHVGDGPGPAEGRGRGGIEGALPAAAHPHGRPSPACADVPHPRQEMRLKSG